MKRAIEGINLKGYYAWSVIDLLSWLNGYKSNMALFLSIIMIT